MVEWRGHKYGVLPTPTQAKQIPASKIGDREQRGLVAKETGVYLTPLGPRLSAIYPTEQRPGGRPGHYQHYGTAQVHAHEFGAGHGAAGFKTVPVGKPAVGLPTALKAEAHKMVAEDVAAEVRKNMVPGLQRNPFDAATILAMWPPRPGESPDQYGERLRGKALLQFVEQVSGKPRPLEAVAPLRELVNPKAAAGMQNAVKLAVKADRDNALGVFGDVGNALADWGDPAENARMQRLARRRLKVLLGVNYHEGIGLKQYNDALGEALFPSPGKGSPLIPRKPGHTAAGHVIGGGRDNYDSALDNFYSALLSVHRPAIEPKLLGQNQIRAKFPPQPGEDPADYHQRLMQMPMDNFYAPGGKGTRVNAGSIARPVVAPEHLAPEGEPNKVSVTGRIVTPAAAQLEQDLKSGIDHERHLGGGVQADTSIVYFKDGAKAVRKKFGSGYDCNGNDKAELFKAEFLAGQVAEAIGGTGAPPVIVAPRGRTVYMGWAGDDAKVAADHYGPEDLTGERAQRIGLLDILLDNSDRHIGNYMFDADGEPIPIDNSSSWGLRGGGWPGPFRKNLAKLVEDGASVFTEQELAAIHERIAALSPVFDKMGHRDWAADSLRRLDRFTSTFKAMAAVRRWDADQHPREPRGTSHGGQFAGKPGTPEPEWGPKPAYKAAPVWKTADGKWTVTVVKLSNLARPSRFGDPEHGPGEYLLAKAKGMFVYAKTVPELVAKTGIDLKDLHEVAG